MDLAYNIKLAMLLLIEAGVIEKDADGILKIAKDYEIFQSGFNPDQQKIIKPNQKKKELTSVQRIVEAYKVAKGIEKNDKGWDRANFGRYSKAAKSLLECFKGEVKAVAAYIFIQGVEWDEKDISWTLETINRHAWDERARLTSNLLTQQINIQEIDYDSKATDA